MIKDDKKNIRAWAMYDWANSAYSLIITSAIFPAYYSALAPDKINLFGRTFPKSTLASYSISISFLVIALLSPMLSSIADTRANKKAFMRFFCYLGSFACILLFFFSGKDTVIWGLACSMIASVGYCGSIVFYNAFLPEIATKENQDRVSAKGFAMGYIGSVLLMVVCFAFILLDEKFVWFNTSLHLPVRISFLLVGLWWIGFAQIPLVVLQEEKRSDNAASNLWAGYNELKQVWHEIQTQKLLKQFLLAFFFYNMGVQTVMYMATYFASDELQMQTTQLLTVVLIIQLVAIAGARLFAWLSSTKGNIFSLSCLVLIWVGICVAAYFICSVVQFYALAFSVGLVMGGIQSLSRSTYSKLLPNTRDTASYFSFYDVCDKIGIVIGTATFGFIAEALGGMRNSALALITYFLLGLFLLQTMRIEHRRQSSAQ